MRWLQALMTVLIHRWPGILISVPLSGKVYGDCRTGTHDVFEMANSIILGFVRPLHGTVTTATPRPRTVAWSAFK
jgi:hypothetical protein